MMNNTNSLDTFIDVCEQFCEAMIVVWPDDVKIKQMQMKMKLAWGSMASDPEAAKKEFITSFHEQMTPFYKDADVKDPSIFKNMKNLDIDMSAKYEQADEDTRDAIWEYIQAICSYSKLYHVYSSIIPDGMAQGITDMATQLAEGMQNGKSLMEMDVMGMGEKIASEMNPDDLQALSQNLMSNLGAITSMIPDSEASGNPEIAGMMGSLMNMLPQKK